MPRSIVPRLHRLRASHPCLMVEILEDMAAHQAALGSPIGALAPLRPFTRGEEFVLHAGVFVTVSGSLLLANLMRDPDHLRFWPWAAGCAAVQVVYWAVTRIRRARSTRSPA